MSDDPLLSQGWQQIEEEFSDPYHVRGLTGVVQSAMAFLSDHPMVVFTLAKLVQPTAKPYHGMS